MFNISSINPITLSISLFAIYFLYNKFQQTNLRISDLEDILNDKKEHIRTINKKITLTAKLFKIVKKNQLFYHFGIFDNDTRINTIPRNETEYKGICMCVLGKKDNKYIKEFISFYKKMGVDKIFLYDNNLRTDEKFEDILKEEIENDFVNISDVRGYYDIQDLVNNDCYQKNRYNYSWIVFFDLDEYIYFKNNKTNLKDFLNHPRFKKCDVIGLNSRFYTDNNYIQYKNESIIKRFSTPSKFQKNEVKSIIRGGLVDFIMEINSPILLNNTCDVKGNIVNLTKTNLIDINYDYAYLRHYYTKTIEEFCNKIKGEDEDEIYNIYQIKMKEFFKINSFSDEKLLFLEKCLNGTKFKNNNGK